MWKAILLLLIVSSTLLVDARSRRKRRQLSSASYYLAGVNPYSHTIMGTAGLTYPSGSFYSAPNYGDPSPSYSPSSSYNMNYQSPGLAQYAQAYPYGNLYNSNTEYQYGATYNNQMSPYDSSVYGPSLFGYAPGGFNNRYPNWHQGNSAQYYSGGSGTGLSNTYNYWYRSLRPGLMRGGFNNGPDAPMDGNPMMPPPPGFPMQEPRFPQRTNR